MAGLLNAAGFALGAAKGFGEGLVKQSEESGLMKRQQTLLELQQKGRMEYLEEHDRLQGERDQERYSAQADLESARETARGRREDARIQAQIDRDKEREKREGGLLANVIQDDEGNYYGVTKGGKRVEIGVKGTPKGATKNEPMVEVIDPDDPTKTMMVPRSEASGYEGKGTKDMRDERRALEDQERASAKDQASKEAADKAGWFSTDKTDFAQDGGSREAFKERRANEIMAERRKAQGRSVPAGGGGTQPAKPSGALSGAGTKDDPFKASGQKDIDWFKANGKPGQVLEFNGKRYTK